MTVIRPNSISGITSITAQNSALNFYDSAGSKLTVDANIKASSIGVGTDNPSKPLQVHSDSSSAVLVTGYTPQIRFNSNVGDGTDADRVILGRATGNDQFIPGSVDGDAILRCATSKKVMIGYGTTEIAQFNSSGLKFKTSGMGIDFSATADGSGTDSSELLDDYEEGTFTPEMNFGNLSVSSHTTTNGFYVKVGRHVRCDIWIRFSGANLSGTPAAGGQVWISGLPYAGAVASGNTQWVGTPVALGRLPEYRGANDSTDFNKVYLYMGNNSSVIYLGVNKDPQSPISTDFLYGMSEKSFSSLIGQGYIFEFRTSLSYMASS